MRFGRIAFILLALYFVFLGGSAYYGLFLSIRTFHHIFTTLVLGLWLFARIRSGKGMPQTALNIPIYAAIGVWIITAISSIDPRMAVENLWFQLVHVVFFFALVDLIQRGRQRLVMETQFMLAAVVIFISGLEIASWYFGLGIIPGTQIGWIDVIGPGAWLPIQPIRLAWAMNISTLLAGYVAPLVTLCLAWAITARRNFRNILWAMTGILLIILILTFSRGGILSVLAAVGTLGVLRFSQMKSVSQRIPTRAIVVAAGLAGIVATGLFVILSISQSGSRTSGDLGRLDMWSSAVRMTGDDILTGVGPGLFGRAFREYRSPTTIQDKLASAHNVYLNTAAETGLLGIVVSLWIGFALVIAWRSNWQAAETQPQKIRLEAALAALIGIGVHSLVDVFTVTPIMTLILLLVAVSITRPTRSKETTRANRGAAIGLLVAVLAYGTWFIPLDMAQNSYENSFRDPQTAIVNTRAAAQTDPALNLYPLQLAHLAGQEVLNTENPDYQAAMLAYEQALELEPTWDTGWINLAALKLSQSDWETALIFLDTARNIKSSSPAQVRWAELADRMNAASDEVIVAAYVTALEHSPFLPLADFWSETDLRRRALDQYLETLPLDWQYRILMVHDPQRAYALIPTAPNTGAESWIMGEYVLTVEGDAEAAVAHFSEAINRDRTQGDYYVSRARAALNTNVEAAQRDLNIATLLGTTAEYPNAVRAELVESTDDKINLWASALPPRFIVQEFAAVLYARPAQFDVFPEMRYIGPGRVVMQPWYNIAEQRAANGETERVINVYRAILDYAPDETEARQALEQLTNG